MKTGTLKDRVKPFLGSVSVSERTHQLDMKLFMGASVNFERRVGVADGRYLLEILRQECGN